MMPQELMEEIEKKEEEILRQNLEHINYSPFNSLPAYVFILNNILPENSELIKAFSEVGITDKRIIADHMTHKLAKLKGTAE